jgi:hypothetical protein
MAIRYAAQKPPEKIEKHYTPLDLARRLVALVPLRDNDAVVDPAAGKNLVFYRVFPRCRKAYDIENGDDFLALSLTYDWAITNPPITCFGSLSKSPAARRAKVSHFL